MHKLFRKGKLSFPDSVMNCREKPEKKIKIDELKKIR